MHVFEKANLGIAPFQFVRMEVRTYQACTGAPVQVGGSCDYCSTGIKYCCIIRDAKGREFKVGTDCVEKTGDAGLMKDSARALSDHQRQIRSEKRQAIISEAKIKLADASFRTSLKAIPHPNSYFASQGKTKLDYFEYMGQCLSEATARQILKS